MRTAGPRPSLEALINRWWSSTAEEAPFIYPKLRALAERWREHPDYGETLSSL